MYLPEAIERFAKCLIKYDDNYLERRRYVKKHKDKVGWEDDWWWQRLLKQEKSLRVRGEKIAKQLGIGLDNVNDVPEFWKMLDRVEEKKKELLKLRLEKHIITYEGEGSHLDFHCSVCDGLFSVEDSHEIDGSGLVCYDCFYNLVEREVG